MNVLASRIQAPRQTQVPNRKRHVEIVQAAHKSVDGALRGLVPSSFPEFSTRFLNGYLYSVQSTVASYTAYIWKAEGMLFVKMASHAESGV